MWYLIVSISDLLHPYLFRYIGVVFIFVRSFAVAQIKLSGQEQKAIFTFSKNLHNFTCMPPKHKLDLFD